MRGIKETWLTLRQRPCANCGAKFRPARPEQRFHSERCRKEYNRYGGAYATLRQKIERVIEQRMREEVAELRREVAALHLDLQKEQDEVIQLRHDLDAAARAARSALPRRA